MKKITLLFCIAALSLLNTGCATIFMGTNSANHCNVKPSAGEAQRDIHVGALVFDILLFWPGAIVDFADGAIWKPCANAKPNNK